MTYCMYKVLLCIRGIHEVVGHLNSCKRDRSDFAIIDVFRRAHVGGIHPRAPGDGQRLLLSSKLRS